MNRQAERIGWGGVWCGAVLRGAVAGLGVLLSGARQGSGELAHLADEGRNREAMGGTSGASTAKRAVEGFCGAVRSAAAVWLRCGSHQQLYRERAAGE